MFRFNGLRMMTHFIPAAFEAVNPFKASSITKQLSGATFIWLAASRKISGLGFSFGADSFPKIIENRFSAF